MKLWMKITILCSAIMIISMIVCNGFSHYRSKDTILRVTEDNVVAEHQSLVSSFSEMVNYYCNNEMDSSSKRTAVKYCFSRFASDKSVLLDTDGTLYSRVTMNPEIIMPITERYGPQNLTLVEGTQRILIVGSSVSLLDVTYWVYTIDDITSTYSEISRLGRQFAFISAIGVLSSFALVAVLVLYALRPLKHLNETALRISQGEYGEVAVITAHDEVGTLANSFNLMSLSIKDNIELLTDAAERQRLFMSGLTHEFRTPLSSIMGLSETLAFTKQPEDVVRQSLIQINEKCQWLTNLTQKLYAVISIGKEVDKRQVGLKELFERLKESTLETLDGRGIAIKCIYEPGYLEIDADLMLAALINLVENASKASEPGSTIYVRAFDKCIVVEDNGKGIPQEKIQRVTEPFYTADSSRSKKAGGAGLGLAIVKLIVDAHSAQLIIESELGHGTTVKIILP